MIKIGQSVRNSNFSFFFYNTSNFFFILEKCCQRGCFKSYDLEDVELYFTYTFKEKKKKKGTAIRRGSRIRSKSKDEIRADFFTKDLI